MGPKRDIDLTHIPDWIQQQIKSIPHGEIKILITVRDSKIQTIEQHSIVKEHIKR